MYNKKNTYLHGICMGLLIEYLIRVNHRSLFAIIILTILVILMIISLIPDKSDKI